MKTFILLLLLISSAFSQSPTVQAVINQTNIDSLLYFVKELSGEVQTTIGGSPYTIVSRNKFQPSNDKAADYIKQKLGSYGLATYDQWFSGTGRNVYGVQTGTEFPNKKYMICAHYDDMPSGTTAPGSDDNASGTAAVIEAARIFTQFNSKYTIIYALWDEEEQGLVGSAYYALQANNADDSIMGVINMDMIAWDNDMDGVGEIHIRNFGNSYALKDTMLQVNTTYSIGVIPSIANPGTTASDQASFWNNGYGALLLIEEYYGGDFNGYYHTVNDKTMYFNLPYYLKMSKLALATTATLAKLETSTFALSVSVANGWNMLSIPGLLPTNQNVTTWWPGKDPASDVFKFQTGYQPVTSAVPGTGYWMKNVGAQIYNTGDEWPADGIQMVPQDPIPIYPGWNLFGVYECAVSAGNLTTTPPLLQTGSVYGYSGGYIAATTLYPGYAYWLHSTGTGFLNIPGCSEAAVVVTRDGTENFGRIIITDNTEKNYTLYAADDEADLNRFILPPYPPQGTFDVRFSSQRYAERLNSTPQTIEMSGIKYPVKVRAEEINLILSDETGRVIARLKAGEEITLNTSINKMMVSEHILPAEYSLGQNYPNPFNPSTMIQFSIPEDVQNVKLIIYSSLGEKIAELVNTGLQAGVYQYNWNAADEASGLYIYQVVTEKFVSTKKMMLIR